MTYLYKEHRRVLLVDANTRKLNLRAAILRNREVEVDTAGGLEQAAPLWRKIAYDFVLLAVADDAIHVVDVMTQIRKSNPRQRIGLLVGPPAYIREIGQAPKPRLVKKAVHLPEPVSDDVPAQQWGVMVQKVMSDWYKQQAMLLGSQRVAS